MPFTLLLSLTTVLGGYIYIETSSPRKLGDKFLIRSPSFTLSDSYCFSYFYNMNGVAINAFQLKDHNKVLQQFNGNKGDVWRKSQVTLTPGNHQVRQ